MTTPIPDPPPPRFNVLGVSVNALNLPSATERVVAVARERAGGYVCFCDVNSVQSAQRDPAHGQILNRSALTLPDGMPIVWMGRQAGHKAIGRVYGPDLLLSTLAATEGSELSHFFFGAGPGTADLLVAKLSERFPAMRVAGTYSPPFRALTEHELLALEQRVGQCRPNFFWVGLSTPTQERFMATAAVKLDVGVSLGIGAAFDFLSGRVRQAPRWIQRSGFEWLWRLSREPRRLGPRYLKNNPLFVLRAFAQLSGLRRYRWDG